MKVIVIRFPTAAVLESKRDSRNSERLSPVSCGYPLKVIFYPYSPALARSAVASELPDASPWAGVVKGIG